MYVQLVRLRLRWYARTGGELVWRHWQWFVLACIVVPGPPVISIFQDVAALLAASVSPDLCAAQHVLAGLVIDLAAILWIVLQRHALSGGAFMRYAGSLPLSRRARLGAEATLLMAANSVILVSAAIAVAHMVGSRRDPFAIFCFMALLGLAASAQRTVLTRHYLGLLGVFLGNGMLVAGLAAPVSLARWLLPILALGCAGIVMLAAERIRRASRRRRFGFVARPMAAGLRVLARQRPALLVQCKAVAECPGQTMVRIGVAVALALGADRLIAIFRFDGRALPTAILAMAAITLILAGFYRVLSNARRTMTSYLTALPLPRHYWSLRDTKFVLLLNGVPLTILLSPQILRGLLPLLVVFALAVAYQVLLALLRWPVLYGGRRSLIYGVLLTVLWSGAAIAAVSR